MQDSPVPLIRIMEEERNACLMYGYRPPPFSPQFQREDFVAEWEVAFRRVKSALEHCWNYGISDGDFFIDGDLPEDRMVFVEIANARMIERRLLTIVHSVVSELPADYTVAMCNSFVFLKTENNEVYPDFNVFVERDRILVYSQSDLLFQQLELSPRAQ